MTLFHMEPSREDISVFWMDERKLFGSKLERLMKVLEANGGLTNMKPLTKLSSCLKALRRKITMTLTDHEMDL